MHEKWDLFSARAQAFVFDRIVVLVLALVPEHLAGSLLGDSVAWTTVRLWQQPLSAHYAGIPALATDFILGFAFMLPIVFWMALLAAYVVVGGMIWEGTLGMRLFGLKMSTASARTPGAIRILCWHGLAHLSMLPLFAGFWWILIDRKARTWHDYLSGVTVGPRGDISQAKEG